MKKLKQKDSLTTQAYEEIRKAILNRELEPGEKLNETLLAEKLDVSRTVVQKALMRLLQEGLVDKSSKYTQAKVREYSEKDIINIWELRIILEGFAAQKAAEIRSQKDVEAMYDFFNEFMENKGMLKNMGLYQKRDRKFHSYIINMSKNNLLKEILERFNIQINSFDLGIFREPELTIVDHLEIIERIKNQEGELARKAMVKHLNKSFENIKEEIIESNDLSTKTG